MPLYEYACPKCGRRFEELVRADAPAPACPQCGSKDGERLICAPAAAPQAGTGLGGARSACAGGGGFS